MRSNIGNLDRAIRVALGLILLAFALHLGFPNTGWNWTGWIGVVLLGTAIFRYCPAYTIIGLRTGS